MKGLAACSFQRSVAGSPEINSVCLSLTSLMDMSDLLELSKGLSKIGAKIFESLWFKLRTSKAPFSFLAYTCIRCY